MKKIAVLKIDHTYANTVDSETRANRFYDWLINKAINNLLEKQKGIDNNSTQKYTVNDEKNRRGKEIYRPSIYRRAKQKLASRRGILNPRRSSQNSQSREDYYLSNVPSRQAPSSEIWQGLENKQQEIKGSFGGEV